MSEITYRRINVFTGKVDAEMTSENTLEQLFLNRGEQRSDSDYRWFDASFPHYVNEMARRAYGSAIQIRRRAKKCCGRE